MSSSSPRSCGCCSGTVTDAIAPPKPLLKLSMGCGSLREDEEEGDEAEEEMEDMEDDDDGRLSRGNPLALGDSAAEQRLFGEPVGKMLVEEPEEDSGDCTSAGVRDGRTRWLGMGGVWCSESKYLAEGNGFVGLEEREEESTRRSFAGGTQSEVKGCRVINGCCRAW